MKIQSLSVVVPSSCLNNCGFCVAHMHREDYINQIEENKRFRRLYKEDFKKRLLFARDNGCNTVILTGDGEPLLNYKFLEDFGEWNSNLPNPFRWIELQTSGTKLNDEYLRFLRNSVGITTISLSLSSIFSSQKNAEYNKTKRGYEVDIPFICKEIKRYDFNLRLSLNLTDAYNNKKPEEIFNKAKELQANQITFRKLYKTEKGNTIQDKWIDNHGCNEEKINEIKNYIKKYGKPLEILPFGAIRYSVDGISTVVDDNCMAEGVTDVLKYLILRPDCKLYSRWDDKGSLVF